MELKDIGNLISETRIKKGMTIGELAEKVGVTTRAIYYWEKGIKIPTLIYADKVLNALDEQLIIGKR